MYVSFSRLFSLIGYYKILVIVPCKSFRYYFKKYFFSLHFSHELLSNTVSPSGIILRSISFHCILVMNYWDVYLYSSHWCLLNLCYTLHEFVCMCVYSYNYGLSAAIVWVGYHVLSFCQDNYQSLELPILMYAKIFIQPEPTWMLLSNHKNL